MIDGTIPAYAAAIDLEAAAVVHPLGGAWTAASADRADRGGYVSGAPIRTPGSYVSGVPVPAVPGRYTASA